MRRRRKIKILATLGPSSNTRETIEQLFQAGADLFRINMSHTSHDAMRTLVATIRDVESQYDRPIGIVADMQGPKLRIGSFAKESVALKKGQKFVLDSDQSPGSAERVLLPHPEILAAQSPEAASKGEAIWKERFRSILAHEKHLDRNGTKIVKVFLHISKDEQRKRFLARIDDPDKNWKFGEADMKARAAALGYRLVGGSPEQLSAFLRSDIDKWANVAKKGGLVAQ